MTSLEVRAFRTLRGQVQLPGDKSISHRAIILNGLGRGCAHVQGLLDSEDVGASVACMQALGVEIERGTDGVRVYGSGGRLEAPEVPLYCGNSGTTMRLLSGVLAGQAFESCLDGDASLRRRPMGRVTEPLRQMGAEIRGQEDGLLAPLWIRGGGLQGRTIHSGVASAQVRSAVLLAGLAAEGRTTVTQPGPSRDHTERMLRGMGVSLEEEAGPGLTVSLEGGQRLEALDVEVPADVSSAAFFLVAAACSQDSALTLPRLGLNPTRTGIVNVLRRMGACIQVDALRDGAVEPVGDLRIVSGPLQGVRVAGAEVPAVIDELPVLAIAAAMAHGETEVADAAELRVKESDRIESTVAMVRALGGKAEARPDGFIIEGSGGAPLPGGGAIDACGDHRIAMAGVIGAGLSQRPSVVHGAETVAVSFPRFFQALEELRAS